MFSRQTISTVAIPVPTLKDEQVQRLEAWLRCVLWDSVLILPPRAEGTGKPSHLSVFRVKGRLVLDSGAVKMVQAVREVFEITDAGGAEAGGGGALAGKLVLIGRGLAGLPWEESVRHGVAGSIPGT
jgi:hypothetical protein